MNYSPQEASALRTRGDAKRMLNDQAGAITDLDAALKLEPRNSLRSQPLDDCKGAIADLDIALELDPRTLDRLTFQWCSQLSLSPQVRPGLTRIPGRSLATARAGAIADLDLALVIEPANALTLLRRGEAKRQRGDFQGALGDLKLSCSAGGWWIGWLGALAPRNLALQLEPLNAKTLCSRSEIKLMLDDLEGATVDADSALRLDPENAGALRRGDVVVTPGPGVPLAVVVPCPRTRGELKRLYGDFAGALADLDLALLREPRNAAALSSRGDAKRMLDDGQGALEDLSLGDGEMVGGRVRDLALELFPHNALDLARRGEVKREQGDFVGAILDLDLSLELDPQNPVALSSRGDAKRMLNDARWQRPDCVGALEDLDRALQLDPENAFAQFCREEAKKVEESGPWDGCWWWRMAGDGGRMAGDGWFVAKSDSLAPLSCAAMAMSQRWAIVGGPVSLTLALSLAESMHSRGLDPQVATGRSVRRAELRSPRCLRGDAADARASCGEMRETKLLAKAQQAPFNTFLRIHSYEDTDLEPQWFNSLPADVVVTDDRLAARRAAPMEAFVNPAEPVSDAEGDLGAVTGVEKRAE
eukprot:Skav231131  [mRNA]  locus=scaffold992:88159:102990:+ [translate_table: standard]